MEQHVPVAEIAASLSCSEETVRRMIRSGQIEALNVGTKSKPSYRLRPSAVELALSNGTSSGNGRVRRV